MRHPLELEAESGRPAGCLLLVAGKGNHPGSVGLPCPSSKTTKFTFLDLKLNLQTFDQHITILQWLRINFWHISSILFSIPLQN